MSGQPRRYGYLAAAWCASFAAVHLYWAAGGTLGLASSAGVELATQRPTWFVLGGLWGVALALLIGAGFSIGLARWRRPVRTPRLVGWLGLLGGGLLLARGLAVEVALMTGIGGLPSTVGPQEARWSLLLWNPWFVLGGVLVLVATRQFGRAIRSG